MLFFWLLFFTLLSSILSLAGGVLLLWKEHWARYLAPSLVAFAAGSMLAVSFLDAIPESLGQGTPTVLTLVLLGILTFFVLERFLLWFHHHHEPHDDFGKKNLVYLITLGDALHNFVDGVALASAFLVSFPLGIVTAFSIALHELPQEIGDFAVLLSAGLKRTEVFFWNFVSALSAFLGAVATFFFLQKFQNLTPYFLAFAAGSLIYIASSDLIPELHREYKRRGAFLQTIFLFLGVILVWVFGLIFKV